ncbi:MAG: glycosyl hydrolase [Halorhabdus sp.]
MAPSREAPDDERRPTDPVTDGGRPAASASEGPTGRAPAQAEPNRSLSDPAAWPPIHRETRPWTRWWWMGNAVEPGDIERELSRLDEVGVGGVEITPIYGVDGEEHRSLPFLGDEWIRRFEHTVAEATRRGMGVDTIPGTGWHYGGPSVDARDAAADLDAETTVLDGDETFEGSLDPDRVSTVVAYGSDDRTVELTDRVDADGTLEWDPPEDGDEWRVVAVSAAPGRQVKRAAPDREGPMINPYYPAAMERYLRQFDAEFAPYDGPPLRAMFHDSFEYDATWSPVLLDVFEEARGYPLEEHLPALLGDHPDEDRVARVKADYRRTLAELFEETITIWRQWAHRSGWLARFQAHCAPGNILDLYALGDVPETEFILDQRNLPGAKLSSSAAHVTGKRLVSAETGTWLDEHFQVTLADVKEHVDRLFLAGVNHVVYHGTAYSPDDAPWPGWLFYASTQFNDRNPIWRDFEALNEYVTRCQAVLQFGDPDADVLLYWPVEDRWHDEEGLAERLQILQRDWFEARPFGRVARLLWEEGYAVDYVSDRQLGDATVRDGRVALPGGTYDLVVVPTADHVPVATLSTLLDLADDGATVGFQDCLPDDVPGLGDLAERRERRADLVDGLSFAPADGAACDEADRGDGRVLRGDVEDVVDAAAVRRESLVDAGLQFERRTFDGGTHYFVVNRGEDPLDEWVVLSVDAATVVALDPMDGGASVAATRDHADGTAVRLQLQPDESVVLRSLDEGGVDAPVARYWTETGHPARVEGPWSVEFVRGGPERPPSAELSDLVSWTELGAPHRRFAGTARYAATFDRPATGDRWWLDLGTVHESARVWVNGRDLGTAIHPPYRLPVDDLAAADNTLRVEVTSVAANRVRDLDRGDAEWKVFQDTNFVDRSYEPFDAADWPVQPAGLLGPVRVVPRRATQSNGGRESGP